METLKVALVSPRRQHASARTLPLAAFDLLPLAELAKKFHLIEQSNGLAVEADIDPEAVPDDLLGRVLTLIAGDAMAKLRDAEIVS